MAWTRWGRRGDWAMGLLAMGLWGLGTTDAQGQVQVLMYDADNAAAVCLEQECRGAFECDSVDAPRCTTVRWHRAGASGGMADRCAYADGNVVCSADEGASSDCSSRCASFAMDGEAWVGGALSVGGATTCLCWRREDLMGSVWEPSLPTEEQRRGFFCGLRSDYTNPRGCFRDGDENPVGYLEGDCDGDGIPNKDDRCPCTAGSGVDAGCPMPSIDGGVIADGGGMPDAGAEDGGGMPGAGAEDGGGMPDADASSPGDAAFPDAGEGASPEGAGPVGFQGGGGCACALGVPANSFGGGALWALGFLGLLLRRRGSR